ncbi:MAG: bifunctional 5,10-methylenetetrahydrofolate dehydrogenase/5,10-methenyltetrahydrofolate cyclohydrolase [Aquificaceae bacterium]|nr:bifunctional 5,10-methylenetetrahydrofolate dehydrogenase/5,10-methenyltetrahydrofolate cyclohydrolase [Aquificaceae bacterium]MDW8237652.1 bifunctional 5,10-methylenetetrahydrofolate dehydrogenase/5,10-methenyltetrahydrofolate cyclohydrolase [Aquificaceae bacterium]
MAQIILSGKLASAPLRESIKEQISALTKEGLRPPCLCAILVGNDPASQIYISNKQKSCASVGINSKVYHLSEHVSKEELVKLIHQLNLDESVDGIIVQLPLPKHIDQQEIISSIDPTKDVDGFHPINLGFLMAQVDKGFIPCTPLGVELLLKHYGIDVKGAEIAIVGTGFIVGRPLGLLMLWKGATIRMCNINTKDISVHTREADIVISAVGKPSLIKASMVKPGAVVVDIGITRVENKVLGDVDYDEVAKLASAITPVPGGVGPMTVTALLLNTLKAYIERFSREGAFVRERVCES